jgi:hypothetical protein
MKQQKTHSYLVTIDIPGDTPLHAETVIPAATSQLQAKMAATRQWYNGRSYFGNVHRYMKALRMPEEEECYE